MTPLLLALAALATPDTVARAAPAAPTNVSYRVIVDRTRWGDTVDVVVVTWTPPAGAAAYHVRLVDSAQVIPAPPADVYKAICGACWHQGAAYNAPRSADTFFVRLRAGDRYPTKAVVRALDSTVTAGPFGVSPVQGLSRCPCAGPKPAPDTVHFGAPVGTTSGEGIATLANATPDTLWFLGGSTMSDTTNFRYVGDNCGPPTGTGWLLAAASCTLRYVFQPKAAGPLLGDNQIRTSKGVARVLLLGTTTVNTPPPPIYTVGITPAGVGIRVGDLYTFTVVVRDQTGAVATLPIAWSTAAPAIATVDSFGTCKGLAVGSTTVTAVVGGKTVSATLDVTAALPVRRERVYADVTLKNGKLFVFRVDSATESYVQVIARSSTKDSLGRYRGTGYLVRPLIAAGVYGPALAAAAADVVGRTDTSDVSTSNALATNRVRCASTGCWLNVVNKGRTGSWTSSPKLLPPYLFGLARALMAAGRGDSLPAPADSLPYVRTTP